jgi:2'-5' RNA ligase
MQAIATLVNEGSNPTASQLWEVIRKSCDINGIRIPEDPHFSWMVADKFNEDAVIKKLHSFSGDAREFEVTTTGLGIFTGEKPILYLPIVKTQRLLEMHQTLWSSLYSSGENQSKVYQPLLWIPHITVISGEIPSDRFNCLLEAVLSMDLTMTIRVNNVALIYSDADKAGIRFVQKFGTAA